MKYPNLTAEYEATGCHISTLANHANTTVELMSAILYGDAEIRASESVSLYHLLSDFSGYEGYSLEYLLAPRLSALNPRKSKTKYRTCILREKINIAAGCSYNDSRAMHNLAFARNVLSAMERGKPVTYAAYRHSILNMDHIVALVREKSKTRRGLSKTKASA